MRVRWSGVIGIGVTLLLLWWVLHDVKFTEVWGELRRARWGWLLAAVAVATATFPLRAVRWRILLQSDGPPPALRPVWHATAIGFMANNILGRWGELARVYAARQILGIRFPHAAASVGVERLFDGLAVVGLLVVGLGAGGFAGEATIRDVPVSRIATSTGLLFGVAFALALAVVIWPAPWLRFAERAAGRLLPATVAERLVSFFEGVLEGLVALRAPRRLVTVLVWSAVIWVVGAASFALAFRAFHLPLPWGAAFLLQGLIALGVAIPSAPGFFGVFEAVAIAVLGLYGVHHTQSVSLAIGYHITTFVPIVGLGVWSLARANMRLDSLRDEPDGGMAA
jgi:uncharacterized protein (TIRG00374 family)